jgi:hypothetical protein
MSAVPETGNAPSLTLPHFVGAVIERASLNCRARPFLLITA